MITTDQSALELSTPTPTQKRARTHQHHRCLLILIFSRYPFSLRQPKGACLGAHVPTYLTRSLVLPIWTSFYLILSSHSLASMTYEPVLSLPIIPTNPCNSASRGVDVKTLGQSKSAMGGGAVETAFSHYLRTKSLSGYTTHHAPSKAPNIVKENTDRSTGNVNEVPEVVSTPAANTASQKVADGGKPDHASLATTAATTGASPSDQTQHKIGIFLRKRSSTLSPERRPESGSLFGKFMNIFSRNRIATTAQPNKKPSL